MPCGQRAFRRRHHAWLVVIAACALLIARAASAQVGALVSPGPLSRAHANLEGIANCQKCHEPGQRVSAAKCLSCHKPIAERIAAKKGVHRSVSGACETCHAEHAGVDAELRPFDPRRFDHAAETGFRLDGRHAPLACARCHKTRSFVTVSAACASCHQDVHKGALGPNCSTCHTTSEPFNAARTGFDHAKTRFPLTGAHRQVTCEKCHVNKVFTGLKFDSCSSCHREPHRGMFGSQCTSCHSTETWKTRKVDHGRTAFPLTGAHATVPCASCHTKPPMQARLQSARCSSCHEDVHRGQFKQDCGACHTSASFKKAPFDHATTRFPLTGRHAALACSSCHKGAATTGPAKAGAAGTPAKVVFSGLSASCSSCHDDVHRGAAAQACESCHTTSDFHSTKPYAHAAKLAPFFAGRHASATCRACHGRSPTDALAPRGNATTTMPTTWAFKGVATACTACHADPHKGEFGQACERCHAVESAAFAASRFSHAATAFPLTGRHEGVACRQCHVPQPGGQEGAAHPLRFTAAKGSTCATCHKDVHLGQLGARCQACHSPDSFKVLKYQHKQVPQAFFAGGHASAACGACHKTQTGAFPAGQGTAIRFVGGGTRCASCHADKDAHHGALGQDCERCHVPDRWPVVSRAFHKLGLFPLEGRHLTVPCASCHLNGVTKGTPTRCFDCHWVRRQDDLYETRLGSECESCHRPISWTAVSWSHASRTGVPLNASHQTLRCDSCHVDRRFGTGAQGCAVCHMGSYNRTTTPNHLAAGFPTTCEVCHLPAHNTWTQAAFSHAIFPLVGVHATIACSTCHRNNVYAGTARTCVGCHQADYQKTTSPNHAAAGFPTACEQCHSATAGSWNSGSFNHAAYFPLVGVHAAQACSTCHKNNVYAGTPTTCVGCHQADYQKTTSPNHSAAGFPTTCEQCHQASASSWSGGAFNHASVFPLVGVHATQACSACHKNNVYAGTPTTCVGCHLTNYQKTTSPNHSAAGFPATCEQCHQASASSWSGGSFNHASVYPLVGVHAAQACTACHKNGVYAGTPTTCVGCHQADYQKTTDPNHAAAGFPTTCEQCHQAAASTWSSSFDHNQFFPLLGRHLQQPCSACHKNNVYGGTPSTCVACHLTQYQQTTNPNHASAGFPTTCETCHKASDGAWTGGKFDHASVYPLVGVHATQACTACHTSGSYASAPTTCVGCHLANYQKTTSPNHASAGFPTTCETCHKASDSSWTQGTFNHSAYYTLVGVHATQACSACHKNNVYAGTPTTCVGCHLTAYQNATDPNHVAAGFPTTCDSCHKASDTSWNQGTFTHTWFPITSGRHAGLACAACHTTSSNYALFSCVTGCHARSSTDSNHSGVSGYRYDSAACYACHPTGRGGRPRP